MLLDGEARVVEPHAPTRELAGRRKRLDGALEHVSRDDLALEGVGHLRGRLGGVAKVGEEQVAGGSLGEDPAPARSCR